MMTIKELENRWNTIDPYTKGYLLISGEHPLSFHIGYFSDEQKSFIVLNTGKIDKLKSSKAITVECIDIGRQQFGLRFVLNYPSLDEIFVKLCWDLIESSRNCEFAVSKVKIQYDKWMLLLQKITDDILPISRQKGLIGELLYLLETLDCCEPEKAINAWVGPEGSDQDFCFNQSWVEVKTVSIAATEVKIASLQQLDRLDEGYLIVYFMDKTTATGSQIISLPKIINQIHNKLSNDILRDIFDCKLVQYGYLIKDEEKYSALGFRLHECRKYVVINDFPRLTRNNVPSGVVNVEYWLSLLAIEDRRV